MRPLLYYLLLAVAAVLMSLVWYEAEAMIPPHTMRWIHEMRRIKKTHTEEEAIL